MRGEPLPKLVGGCAPALATLSADGVPNLAFAAPESAADDAPEADAGTRPSPVFSSPVFAGVAPATAFAASELSPPVTPGDALPRTAAGAPSVNAMRPGVVVAPAIGAEAAGVEFAGMEGVDEDLRTEFTGVRVEPPAPESAAPPFRVATRSFGAASEATGPRMPRPACPKSARPGAEPIWVEDSAAAGRPALTISPLARP